MRLTDKIAIVTGANAEFGSIISKAFAAEGADVVCADWKQEDADIAAERVRAAGRKALALGVDLREQEEVEVMVRRTVETYGRLDILVNATARPHHQEFLNFKEEDFDDTLARGVKPYFLTGQAAANEMVKRRYGKIVNLTSIVSKLGPGQAVDWAADRGAVDGLTRSMAHALGFWGINVNGVARGNTQRPPYSEGVLERLRRLPLGRTEYPEDMGPPTVFLASDDAAYITGTVLYVDGGYTVAAVTDDRFRPEWAKAGKQGWDPTRGVTE